MTGKISFSRFSFNKHDCIIFKKWKYEKSMILAIVGVAMSMSVHAQVQFSKFKFYVADIMDFSHLQLETKFKVTSDRNLKYVHVFLLL